MATGTGRPAEASSLCSDCCSRYPISPCVVASQTSSDWPYTWSEARSDRSSAAPTWGPFPCVTTRLNPSWIRPTMAWAVRRVLASCSSMVPFSPARMSELPPIATSALRGIG